MFYKYKYAIFMLITVAVYFLLIINNYKTITISTFDSNEYKISIKNIKPTPET